VARTSEQLPSWSARCVRVPPQVARDGRKIYDIFEGTEQIQQLVIARAISGRHIA
jgi:alkylation response protein AidB-like acyl-CoA dehydrogenase